MSLPAPRSLFVSVTAWSLIALGILGVLLALLLGALVLLLAATGEADPFAAVPLFTLLPPALQWLLRHVGLLAAVVFVASLAAIPLGVALNRRLEWARRASVWICALLALLHFAAVPWQWREMDHWFAAMRADLPWFARDGLDSFYWSTQLTGAGLTLLFALALAWSAWKLARPAVCAEFRVQVDGS